MQIIIGILLIGVWYILSKIVDHARKLRRTKAVLDKFPMDEKHWFWGHLHHFPGLNEAGLEFLRKRTLRFPRLCSFWSGSFFRGDLILHHPDTVAVVLKTAEPKQMHSGVYKYAISWMGKGLILSDGNMWHRNRRLLTNVFHFEALKKYIQVKNSCTEKFLKHLHNSASNGESVEIFNKISHLTFEIILKCAVSCDSDVQLTGNHHPYLQAVNKLTYLWSSRMINAFHHYDFIYWFTKEYREFKKNSDYVHGLAEKLIMERKKAYELSPERSQTDFLDILLMARDEDGCGLSDLEIRDEINTFLFAGHDTISSAISWALYALANNPEEQIRCQKEVDEILGSRTDDTLMSEDLHKLKYLTQCIKETLRMYTPVYTFGRELENSLVIDGVRLPPKSMVMIDAYSLHHNPSVWPDPMRYDPSRFSPENIDKIDNYAFVPFSAGPRNCIGQNFAIDELRLVVARTLRKFSVAVDTSHPVKCKPSIVMKTENGLFLYFKERI